MVTTNRQIKNRQERFGAFERNDYNTTVSFIDKTEKDSISTKTVDLGSIRTVDSTDSQINYIVSAPVAPSTTEAPVKLGKRHLNVSNKYANDIKNSKVRAGVAPKETIRAKNAIMIAVYCIAVIALVTLIAVNATALASLSAENVALADKLAVLSGEEATLMGELNALQDPARITNLASSALNLNQSASSGVVALAVSPLSEVEPILFNNNWFDKLLDGISSTFGG